MSPVKRASSRVTAIVVTFQSAATVAETLAALRRSHDAGLLDCVVVDNGSTDGTLALLERESAWAEIVQTGRNNGFGRGCNIGLRHVATPYTFFVNPDAMVEPEAVRCLLDFLDGHPDAGIAGPAIVQGEGGGSATLQTTGRRLDPRRQLLAAVPLLRMDPLSRPIQPGAPPFRTEWVGGALLMARTALLRRLGGFDPHFFLYWEEVDLCKRAEEAGFEIWAVGTALGRHVVGASSSSDGTRIHGCIARHYFQSRYYYMRKHHGWAAATAAELFEFATLLLRSAYDVLRGRGTSRLRTRLQAPLLSQPRPPE